MLKGKCVVLGVTGSIAAYKIACLASALVKQHADVHVIMTENATNFINPITFETLTSNKCLVDTFDRNFQFNVEHVALAKRADIFMVAPASANVIGKMANGIADDMLTTTILAAKCPKYVSPAMNTNMYENPIVQENMAKLRAHGYLFVEPESGHLACNTNGKGRFPKLESIMDAVEKALFGKGLLKGKKIIVSAGGTQEAIDPVRYISNRSSGRMGYAIARAAAMEDADVTLVSCTTALPVPSGVKIEYVRDARELCRAMNSHFDDCDAAIMAAAVSDYRPKVQATQKIKKESHDVLNIELTQNPDILYGLGQKKKGQFLVGFAAETNDVIEHGKEKLKRKNLDMLVANDVAMPGAGFNVPTNIASLLYKDGTMEQYPKMTKDELGHIIVEKISEGLKQQ